MKRSGRHVHDSQQTGSIFDDPRRRFNRSGAESVERTVMKAQATAARPVHNVPVHDLAIDNALIHDVPIHDVPIHDFPVHDVPSHDVPVHDVRILHDASIRWMHCFCYFCLVLSVPWSLWITRGWFGVLLHFQFASAAAWLIEKLLRRPSPLRFGTFHPRPFWPRSLRHTTFRPRPFRKNP